METILGFAPVFDITSTILILGSFPSIKSRKEGFYYGNRHNRFWKIIEKCFDTKLTSIQDKKELLLKKHIALWDIVYSCRITGSLDKDIKDYTFVDLKSILAPNSKINLILCNGQTSFNLTNKYLTENNISIETICLPSTSPANTKFQDIDWLKYLRKNI